MSKYLLKDYVNLLQAHNLIKEINLNDELLKRNIDNITYNSKDILANSLFVCKGFNFKKEYLEEAINNKIILYISSEKYFDYPCIIVSDIRKSLALISFMFYNYPYNNLDIIGITGTKGKTTTAVYLQKILNCGILSSLYNDVGVRKEALVTTPESLDLASLLNDAVKNNFKQVVMEVSSQALKYDRVYSLPFKIGVFTNISPDHISPIEHRDFNDYFTSKLKIFKQSEIAIVNLDMEHISKVLESAKKCSKVITYSLKNKDADFYAENIKKLASDKYSFYVNGYKYTLNMGGLFNVSNALASIAVASIFNIPNETINKALSEVKVSGRMETYYSLDKKTIAIVDYAHNKLSFEALLSTVKDEYPTKDIITVFGCPGNKALQRRRDLGEVASRYAKYNYLTEDDPGTENSRDICLEIAGSLPSDKYEIVLDRETAIKKAIINNPNCVIVIAGKGAEIHQKTHVLEDYKGDASIVKEVFEEELVTV